MKKKKYKTVADYAAMCGVSITSVRRWAEEGLIKIETIKHNGSSIKAVDINTYHPRAARVRGRKKVEL